MTFLPVDHHRAVGLKGPKYKVGPLCCNPQCEKMAGHAHHMWRRSEIIKNYDWVQIGGEVFAGKVGVCPSCHDLLTENKIAIQYHDHGFYWCLVSGSKTTGDLTFHDVGLIEPQPLTPELLATLAPDQGVGSEEGCPFCGQLKRRRPSSVGTLGRRRKSWTVKVPSDEEEDGAEVLDALVEDLAPFVPNADTSATGRYYVLVPVLVYASMNAKNFVETMEGVGG